MSQRIDYKPNGINVDIDPAEVGPDFYTWAQNVFMHDGQAERVNGLTSVFDGVLFPPKFLVQTERGNKLFWVYASEENIGVWDGIDHTDGCPDRA